MSGDIPVRKRKGKNKKKELGTESERPAQGSKLQSETSPFIESPSKYSDESTFEQTEDYLDQPTRNGSKKRRQQSPSKSSASSGSGCCAKVLFVFLVTFLVILAALIFIQLHSSEYSALVKESQDSSVRPVENSRPPEDSLASSTHTKRALDIEDIEKQILREEEAEKASFLGVSPRAVDVEIPNDDPDQKTPVQEPPIVKETAHVLGNERVDSDAIQADMNPHESKPIDDDSGVESSADNEGNTNEINLKNDDNTKEIGESQSKKVPEKPDENIKPKRKNRKGSRKAPPSSEEILAHQNTLDRAEMLMSAIGELSPNHPLLEELRPHLDGATRDLKNFKLEGLESTSKHALIILEDLYVRLADAKERGELTTDHSRFFNEESQPEVQVVESAEKTPSNSVPSSLDTLQSSDSSIPTSDSSDEVSASAIGSSDSAPPASNSAPPASESATPASESATPASESATPSSESATPSSESAPPASDATAFPPHTPVSGKNSGAAASKESAPRELSASRGDIGLEDLTEADLASPVDSGDQLLKLREAEALREQDNGRDN